MAKTKTIQSDQFQGRAAISPASVNVEARTVEVVFATEMPVRRYNWDIGYYYEILDCDPKSVRMDRINAGAPVLDNHSNYSVESVLGSVQDAKMASRKGTATIKFSQREHVAPIFQDVQDGILRGISCGYYVHKYMLETPGTDTTLPVYRAIDWEPAEISLAPVPADIESQVRSKDKAGAMNNIIIENFQPSKTMETPENPTQTPNAGEPQARSASPATPPAPAAAPTVTEEQRKAILADESKRLESFRSIASACNLPTEFVVEKSQNTSLTVDGFRALAIEEMAKRGGTQNITGRAAVVADEADTKRRQMEAGLLLRSGAVKLDKSNPEHKEIIVLGNDHREVRLVRLCELMLSQRGVETRNLNDNEIIKRAFSSTSDFPVLLENVLNKVLLNNYQTAPDTWSRFCKIGSVTDFRNNHRLRMGTIGSLDDVTENGEYKQKSIPDAEKEIIKAKRKGNIITVSREMIVNDDVNGFVGLAAMFGRAGKLSIEKDVYAYIAANPVLVDGTAWIHADHNNVAAVNAGPTVTSVDAIRQLMASQMDPSSNEYLDIRPAIIVCPLSLGSTFRVINDSAKDPDAANKLERANPVFGLFKDIVDTPRLSGNAWYAFADPAVNAALEVAFLNGQTEPMLEQETEFKTDGIAWKAVLEYGVGAIDHRSVAKNNGAS